MLKRSPSWNRWSKSLPSVFRSVALKIGPEDALHVLDVLADADLRAGLRLDVGRAGEVVGMGVGFEHPFDRVAGLLGGLQDRLDRARVDLARIVIVVEHRIDHRSLLGRRDRRPDSSPCSSARRRTPG